MPGVESREPDPVAGYLIVADVSIPHSSYYRPSIRFQGAGRVLSRWGLRSPRAPPSRIPDALTLRTYLDGVLVQSASTADLIRPAARLLVDVTEFMTLAPGDVLALGAAGPAPRVRSGQTVTIEIDGLGSLHNPFMDAAA